MSTAPGPRAGQFRIVSCNLSLVLPAYLPFLFAGWAGRRPGCLVLQLPLLVLLVTLFSPLARSRGR